MRSQRKRWLRYLVLASWTLFTISLACWWGFFGLEQIHRLMSLGYGHENDLVRYQRMLFFEGGTLVLSLFAGGATLAYYMYHELKQRDQLRDFFLAFTHDTKTALAAVQLQAEILRERVTSDGDREIAGRMLGDVEKLALQLDNSLYVANLQERKHHLEQIDCTQVIDSLSARFPQMKISLAHPARIVADIRAFESILVNLIHNALIHGHAHNVVIDDKSVRSGFVTFDIVDDGEGFVGKRESLGKKFFRHYSGSGSGLGLHLARALARSMRGTIEFPPVRNGFRAVLELPGELL